MSSFFTNNSELLAWAAPSALVLTASVIQWAYGWRRMLDKIEAALARKVDTETCLGVQADCSDQVKNEIAPIWKSHNSLAKEVAGSYGKLDEAVDTLKEAVKEIRTANGKK